MTATSVTGRGPGSAAGHGTGNKGSEHMSLAVHRLIGPRVVACGDLQLDGGGSGTVYFPELPVPDGSSVEDEYCPFLSTTPPFGGFHASWDNFTTTSFDVSGDDNQGVCWMIIKKGLWGSLNNNGPAEDLADT